MRSEIINRPSLSRTPRSGFALTAAQASLAAAVLGLGLALLMATVQVALLTTLLLFLAVLFTGLILCDATVRRLGDSKLRALKTFWVIKVGLTLLLLYLGWIPELDPGSSANWGYDPQRYFQQAYDLVENDWIPTVGLNYQGILYYYGAFFYVFGHNPVVPALINAFVTLLATLFVIRVAYEFKPERSARDWTIAYLLLIPELLWFDVMTSRETLLAVLVTISTLAAGRYIAGSGKVSLSYTLALIGICFGGIVAIRTSMAIPVVVAITFMFTFLRAGRQYAPISRAFVLTLLIGLLIAAPRIGALLGSDDFNYRSQFERFLPSEQKLVNEVEEGWSDQSIGRLLIPNNAFQSLLFLPPRMLAYLVTPLPNFVVSLSELVAGSYGAWQHLLSLPVSLLNLLVLPYALAGFTQAWKQRRMRPALLIPHIAFWSIFIGIAGGNVMIHGRYRAMSLLLLYTCVWLGYASCTPHQFRRFALPWFALLGIGAVFYLLYKLH